MDYEKKYKAALNWMKDVYPTLEGAVKEDANHYFPELKESKDERIRKAIHIYLDWLDGRKDYAPKGEYSIKDMIAWLEKQSEFKNIDSDDLATLETWEDAIKENKEKWQLSDWFVEATSLLIQKVKRIENNENINIKGSRVMLNACINALRTVGHSHLSDWLEKQGQQKPVDKVEPKFKVGDWIIQENIGVYKVIEVCESWYEVVDNKDKHYSIGFDKEYMCRLWTIQDAKDGDVLYCESGGIEYIVMNKGINEHGNIDSYFRYNSLNGFGVDIPSVFSARQDDITPATKEQRDLLFQKMKEAGYEWDDEKKELKKIEQKPTELSEEDKITLDFLVDYLLDTIKKMPAEEYAGGLGEAVVLLKSLKDRVQPKQEWSKEDVCNLQDIDSVLFYDKSLPEDTCMRLRNWLKSLRPQNTWKPSDRQMNALEHFVRSVGESGYTSPYENNTKLLNSLLSDLKKLRAK